MAVNDSISNMLTVIRNGVRARKENVNIPNAKILVAIADILKIEGFVDNYRVIKDSVQGTLRVYLKYVNKKPVINNLRRVSRPGLRVYAGAENIPYVLRGRGRAILTTSKGIMTDSSARKAKIGGEVLCYIW